MTVIPDESEQVNLCVCVCVCVSGTALENHQSSIEVLLQSKVGLVSIAIFKGNTQLFKSLGYVRIFFFFNEIVSFIQQ